MPPSLFQKPLEQTTKVDVRSVMQWPESGTVEYKSKLSQKDGAPDPWYAGKAISDRSKERLFKGIVALANASGGHLILGIESSGKPPIATAILPVPRCSELAEVLSRSAFASIDPPIPQMQIWGVPTEDDGTSGVVVFRVPRSRSAPHRAPDLHCYYRYRDESKPMTMRQVQDLTIARSRYSENLEESFSHRSNDFKKWCGARAITPVGFTAFRITAMPYNTEIWLENLRNNNALLQAQSEGYRFGIGPAVVEFGAFSRSHNERPILGGVRRKKDSATVTTEFDVFRRGLIEVRFRRDSNTLRSTREELPLISSGNLIADLLNLVQTADVLRSLAGHPDIEYAIEIECAAYNGSGRPIAIPVAGIWNSDDSIGTFQQSPIVFERKSFGPLPQRVEIINIVLRDIYEACGVDPEKHGITISA
jgi:hypothetical protein